MYPFVRVRSLTGCTKLSRPLTTRNAFASHRRSRVSIRRFVHDLNARRHNFSRIDYVTRKRNNNVVRRKRPGGKGRTRKLRASGRLFSKTRNVPKHRPHHCVTSTGRRRVKYVFVHVGCSLVPSIVADETTGVCVCV